MPWGILVVLAIFVVGIVVAATAPKTETAPAEDKAEVGAEPSFEEPAEGPSEAAQEDDWPEPGSGAT